MDKENFKRTFFRYSRQKYAKTNKQDIDKAEELTIVKECLSGGCFYEYSIVWYRLPKGDTAKIEMFDESFSAFEEEKELFQRLSKMKNPTPDGVHLLLLELGYEDISDDKEVPKNAQNIS